LIAALPDAAEDDLRGVGSGAEHPEELPARDDVEAEALLAQQREQREIRRRLHGVAGEEVEPPQRLLEDARVPPQRRGGIDVGGRPHLPGDARERDLLAEQLARPPAEVVHGPPPSALTPPSGAGAPPSAGSGRGGRGGPFTPHTAVASARASARARTIRRGWRR